VYGWAIVLVVVVSLCSLANHAVWILRTMNGGPYMGDERWATATAMETTIWRCCAQKRLDIVPLVLCWSLLAEAAE
jgi:hypothetical protein